MSKDLIEIAYEIAKKKYKKNKFKYRDLLSEIIKYNDEYKNLGGDLYVEIISDIRFLSLGNDEWALQEFYKYSEFEKISSTMFGLENELNDNDIDEEDLSNDPLKNENIFIKNDDLSNNIENYSEEIEIDSEYIKEDEIDEIIDTDIDLDEIIDTDIDLNENDEGEN